MDRPAAPEPGASNPPTDTSRPLQPIRKDLVIRFRRQRLAREAIMAAKEISVKKYVVRLSGEERERLETLIRKGKSPARRVLKARILLRPMSRKLAKGGATSGSSKLWKPAHRWFTGCANNWWKKASRDRKSTRLNSSHLV